MVIIRADKDVDYEDVENLMEVIKTKTRAKKIAIATRQKEVRAAP
jgi:biopolymer transport protein ExbD